MSNYLRYFVVLLLLGSLFYTYSLEVEQSTIKERLDKKLPIVIDKKGFVITLNRIDVIGISNNIVESKVNSTLQVSHTNRFAKLLPKKSIHFTVHSRAIPKVHGKYLSFELLSFKINKFIKFKEVKGILKRKLEAIKIRIKVLEKFAWLASVKDVKLQDNGLLTIRMGVSKWIILLLIALFLLREVGLLLIVLYQKFLSPRKKYRCAKGELHQNGTCSSVTKEAFKNGGFIAGMKAYRTSTKECKQAYKTLSKDKRKDGISCDADYCSVCGGASCGGDAFGSSASVCDVGSAVPCDIGSC